MRRLSIRQPYAELILRDQDGGVSHSGGFPSSYSTMGGDRIIGERFYIYASKAKAAPVPPLPIWSEPFECSGQALRVATPDLRSALGWMLEAEQVVDDRGPAVGNRRAAAHRRDPSTCSGPAAL